ncbi:cytochrome-c peroxidase [Halobacteriovorax sp. HLS]|uniref:cytochrome-c peroxidase n=1 Tax=Halobacteriovorax sp. HLS TaxID=2234000 RepID=UPI000FDC8792|nr:cytochrome c peroxidase [Halobacteriovorax sp. HLS]
MITIFLILLIGHAIGDNSFTVKEEVAFIPATEYLLGKKIFEDRSLSSDKSISCNSCHDLSNYGVDGKRFSKGPNSSENYINTPSIYHLSQTNYFFTDGRETTLSGAISSEIENYQRMNSTWEEFLDKMKSNQSYEESFRNIYGQKITKELVLHVLEGFLMSLDLGRSKFDEHLIDKVKLSKEELNGLSRFKELGCIHCHNGVNLGANNFSSRGVFMEYLDSRSKVIKNHEYGRYNATRKEEDKYLFKVPSLRNIEYTSPYFYFGNIDSLYEAIALKIKAHNGIEPSDKDINAIIIFLRTLSSKKKVDHEK